MATESETVVIVTPAPMPFKRFAARYMLVNVIVAVLTTALFTWDGSHMASILMRMSAICALVQGMNSMSNRRAAFGQRLLFGLAAYAVFHLAMFCTQRAFFSHPDHSNSDYIGGSVSGTR